MYNYNELIPLLLGTLAGGGVLLVWVGLRAMRRGGAGGLRSRGFWMLNGGLVLVALSMILLTRDS